MCQLFEPRLDELGSAEDELGSGGRILPNGEMRAAFGAPPAVCQLHRNCSDVRGLPVLDLLMVFQLPPLASIFYKIP